MSSETKICITVESCSPECQSPTHAPNAAMQSACSHASVFPSKQQDPRGQDLTDYVLRGCSGCTSLYCRNRSVERPPIVQTRRSSHGKSEEVKSWCYRSLSRLADWNGPIVNPILRDCAWPDTCREAAVGMDHNGRE